jgi:transcriptional regulator with XRE-family HTH domain
MAAGGGITYPRVIELLKVAVAEKGQRAVSREAGIALLSVQRYIKGESEPSQASMQKLADYFGVSVAYLRGGSAWDNIGGENGLRGGVSDEDDLLMKESLKHTSLETVLDLEAGIRKFPKLWDAFDSLADEDKREALSMFKSYENLSIAGMRDFIERNKMKKVTP